MPNKKQQQTSSSSPPRSRGNGAGPAAAEPHTLLGASAIARTVSSSVDNYLKQLDGEPVDHLHDLVMGTVERVLIADVLTRCGHNQSEAAAMLGINRNTLRSKIGKYQIKLG